MDREIYAASCALLTMTTDLEKRGLLVGEVRESVAASLDLFLETRCADPDESWHAELVDLYEDLHGRQPVAPSRPTT